MDVIYYAFIVIVLFQVVCYTLLYGRFAFLRSDKATPKNIAISVIICAKNEAENLKKFIPNIIHQDYPDFEIVLINDASHDETLDIMEEFANQHSNVKIVNVKNIEAFWGNKKYALTLGIKASKNEFLLFTDADCKPISRYWIREMSSQFSNTKSIVLGYGGYLKVKNSFTNKLIRFETLVTAIQYFSFTKLGLPYMGVGRNLAYTKKEFFDVNGFINHIKVRSGDDDLFINQVATKRNTAICFSKDSFTKSIPKTNFKDWIKQKRRHITTAKHYRLKHKILLTLIYVLKLLFWLFAVALLISTHHWQMVLTLFLCRLIIQYTVYGMSSKKLDEKDLLWLLPILEIFLILTQLTIFIKNLISKPNHWK